MAAHVSGPAAQALALPDQGAHRRLTRADLASPALTWRQPRSDQLMSRRKSLNVRSGAAAGAAWAGCPLKGNSGIADSSLKALIRVGA